MKLNEYGSPRATRSAKADIAEGMEEVYASHPAEFGQNCPACGAWEDEKVGMECTGVRRRGECQYIDPKTGFHRDDTPVEQDGSCCGCGMI